MINIYSERFTMEAEMFSLTARLKSFKWHAHGHETKYLVSNTVYVYIYEDTSPCTILSFLSRAKFVAIKKLQIICMSLKNL